MRRFDDTVGGCGAAVSAQRERTVAWKQFTCQLVPAAGAQFAGHDRLLPGRVPDTWSVGAAGREGGGQRATGLPVDDGITQRHLPVPCVQRRRAV